MRRCLTLDAQNSAIRVLASITIISWILFGMTSNAQAQGLAQGGQLGQSPKTIPNSVANPAQALPPQTELLPAPAGNPTIDAPIPTTIDNPANAVSNPLDAEPNRLQTPVPFTVRVKDITTIEGHRSNRVQGIGLVMGLKGTGGKGAATQQLAKNVLQNNGILAEQVPTNSLSMVMVTAEIPPFYKPGETLIATVSVYDDANSLFGGQLLSTPLYGIDGQVYALAGGAMEIGGFSVAGQGATLRKNHDTVGKVEAQIEVEICDGPAFSTGRFRLLLRNKDYTTAHRIANEVNKYFPRIARANDGGSVEVLIPQSFARSPLDFLVMINNLRVEPDVPARVVINEKTGTIIVGRNVRLSSFMFAKDNLVIATSETPVASQPAPFSEGETVVLPRTQLQAVETGSRYNLLPANATVGDLANMLNLLGVTPQDIISVFLALHQEGSLHGELIIE